MKAHITKIIPMDGATADGRQFHYAVDDGTLLDVLPPNERTFCLQALAFQRSINALAQYHRLGPWKFSKPDSIAEGE